MSAAYFSDGGSSTESEDDAVYQELNVKSEPEPDAVSPPEAVVKSEAQVVESHVTADDDLEVKPEHLVPDNAAVSTDKSEPPPVESDAPPSCSTCGFQLLVVPQAEILAAETTLDCKCCGLVLPASSYSATQRSKDASKCKACTGNMAFKERKAARPTPKAEKKEKTRSNKDKQRSKEANSVFENKVGRLLMAKRALQRKRDEASKLKLTKRREEYEQQLDKEEKDLARQEALLKSQRGEDFKRLVSNLKIKKPPTYEHDRKEKAKRTRANQKRKQSLKRKAGDDGEPAKKKKTKGPVVDSSVFVPPASAADVAPARVIPTRARARAQTQAVAVKVEVKTEVKTEQPKVEPKTE
ncbi:hypothetical protein PF005_g8260 [Phytophthora fragariae]|uniref:Uncharacterized protein n=1 Tax=Phytophthora fragariae TaxID=53985 RepID=A0A6A3YGC0_9STRA|nr:hypothetical protein PF003_g8701 [Phytophthora fragariae]KAE8941157.1 hypothetical protein PF009_g9048 [Phytophthora fragariae]KAE9015791.1 hypothetical protein PF011_g7452 [Phytophthora fragariae]KAE9085800.1 hypothetical protein PF010_g20327 [Phytophthora fragariae]KAE9118952.1 hypothetical protein PF007_g8732 [Phytophthora fragariae]